MAPHAATGTPAVPDATGPSQSPSRGWLRRPARRGWLAGGVGLTAVAALLAHVPNFYRGCRPGRDEDSGRLISKAATLGSAIGRPGRWATAVTEDEINAWLRTDLPKNHASLLPRGVTRPRVALADDLIRVGACVGWGPASAVASAELKIEPVDAGRLRVDVRSVRLGGLPLPSGPVVHRLARQVGAVGLPNELQRLDGRIVIVVYISGAGEAAGKAHRLDALDIRNGELLLAGETLAMPAAERR